MEVALAPDLERRLVKAVADGRFATASEAVAQGLHLVLVEPMPAAGQNPLIEQWVADSDRSLPAEGGDVPAHVAALLDLAVEDVRLGRTLPVGEALGMLEANFSTYRAKREQSRLRQPDGR